jgi:type II secretory pathway component PulF
MSELLEKIKHAVFPPKNRFLEMLGFSLESGMELKASVDVARTHIETLSDHHRVNMLEAALERGENLVPALLESGLVDIDQLEALKLAEQSGFLPQTLVKMAQKPARSVLLKPIDVSGKLMIAVYLVFLAGGMVWVFMEMI